MLHIWDEYWDLRIGECPCDVHFLEYIDEAGLRDQVIYHFGSGGHHVVGLECARAAAGNVVMSVTASPREYDGYVKLLTEKPEVSHHYVCYFGDIYTFNGRLMPDFDLVTLFHLCEFRSEANDAYGALTDAELLRRLAAKTKPGGRILFYEGSFAYERARPIIAEAAAAGIIAPDGQFKTLPIFKRTTKPV
jgi:SAM-dependent methyltransferase